MLNDTEKNDLRNFLFSQSNVTPQILAEFSTKSDEEIRSILQVAYHQELSFMEKRLIQTQSKIDELRAKLTQ